MTGQINCVDTEARWEMTQLHLLYGPINANTKYYWYLRLVNTFVEVSGPQCWNLGACKKSCGRRGVNVSQLMSINVNRVFKVYQVFYKHKKWRKKTTQV